MSSAINLSLLNANTLLASTFSQTTYPVPQGGAAFKPLAGFEPVTVEPSAYGQQSSGFSATTYVNVSTGQVVIAYRGSDTFGEAIGVATVSAVTGSWDLQFTDAVKYSVAAKAAALSVINAERANTGQPLLENVEPLLTGHSLGGLLSQVVSKMFGYEAVVYDSLGGGRLIGTAAYNELAQQYAPKDENNNPREFNVEEKITNFVTSSASDRGIQLGQTIDIPALGQMGGGGMVATIAAFLVNPVAGFALAVTQKQIAQHGVLSIELAMYGLAALKPLVADQGELKTQSMTLAQATG